jgi:arabinan endo-1,5-alpha-L-arabinosidase
MKNTYDKLVRLVLILVLVFQYLFSNGSDTLGILKVNAAALNTTRVSVHDPSVVKAGGKYYIFGSHMANAVTSDLTSWSTFRTNINTDYASIFSVGKTWAGYEKVVHVHECEWK